MDYTERKALRERKVTLAVQAPIALVEVIDRIADAEAKPVTQVIIRLLREGLAVERAARQADQLDVVADFAFDASRERGR